MIKQDLIERMSKELAQVVATLLGFDTSQKLEYINEYLQTLSLDPIDLLDLSPKELLEKLQKNDSFQVAHLELIANLLHQKALVYYEQDFDAFGHNLMKKALLILEYVDQEMSTFSMERRDLMDSMKADISDEEEDEDDPLA